MGPAVDTESWRKKWAIGQTHFHLPHLHPALERHGHLLLEDNVSAPHFPKRILFPLCGKAVDMPHLALAGHKVVGCDCVRQAADEFIAETKGAVVAGETAVAAGGLDEARAHAVHAPAREPAAGRRGRD